MPNTIKTVADLRAELVRMHAAALTKAMTQYVVKTQQERMVLK